MELFFTALFLVAFSAGIGYWADAWGRNGWAWGVVAFILSPLLVALALLIAGKTVEVKAMEAKRMKDLINS